MSNVVDEEVYAGEGDEVSEAREQAPMQIKQDSLEFALRTLEPPTDIARMLHYTSHVPFRDWCPLCAASRARGSLHRRVVVNKTADTLPKFQADYMSLRAVAEGKTQPCTTFVETRSGAVMDHGFLNPVMRFAPTTSHQSNGFVEAVHRHIQGVARCHRTLVCSFAARSPAIPFAVRFAEFVLTRFTVRPDGRTPFQYLVGTPYASALCVFGDSLVALILDHKVRAAKLTNRWISGCWWGRDGFSDEHLVGTKFG